MNEFNLIPPFKISDISMFSSDVDDNDYIPWDKDTSYSVGDTRMVSNRTAEVSFGAISHVYCANMASATISMFERDMSTGLLAALSPATIATGSGPRSVALSPNCSFIYVSNYNDNTVSMYSRNATTGLLTALSPATIATGNGPFNILISPDGLHVYVSNDVSNTVSMYSLDPSTGLLAPLSPAAISAGTGPLGAAITSDGLYFYVANHNGSDNVSMFSRNPESGLLTALSPATISTGAAPKYISLSPDDLYAYVTNSTDGTLSMFSRSASTGLLSPLTPSTISTGTNPHGVVLSSDGFYAYVVNRGSQNISMYARDPETGLLTALSPSTITSGPGSWMISFSPDENHVCVSNFDNGTVSQYERDTGTGLLTKLSPEMIVSGANSIGLASSVPIVTSTIYWPDHLRNNDDIVAFFVKTGTLPDGVYEWHPYRVINKTADTFQISETEGGSAVTISGTMVAPVYCIAFGESLTYPVTMTLSSDTRVASIFTWPGHGWQNGQPMYLLTTGDLYDGLTAASLYYVVSRTEDTFKLSDELNGAPVKTSGIDGGANFLTALTPPTVSVTGISPREIIVSPDGLHVYVVAETSVVNMYSRDTDTGLLSSLGTIGTGVGPYFVAISPDGLHVYVANNGAATLSMYSRDPSTGLLTALTPATIATGLGPRAVLLSPDGLHVYVADNGAATLSMYSRDPSTGLLTALTPATIATGTNPLNISASTDGLFVYVANNGSNSISMYSRDVGTGLLTALTPATIYTGMPEGIKISGDNGFLYVTNYGPATVSMFSRDTSTGLLTELSPATVASGTGPGGIAISLDGLFVYVANYTDSTLSMYSRDTDTGLLTPLSPASFSTGSVPTRLAITPDGLFIYISNYSGASISMYSRESIVYAVADSHKAYECLIAVDPDSDITPPHKLTAEYLGTPTGATWLDIGAINRWKLFDTSVTSQMEAVDRATFIIQTVGNRDSVFIENVEAEEVIITARASGGGAILYGPVLYSLVGLKDFVTMDIPVAADMEITVVLNNVGSIVKCGMLVVGLSQTFGTTLNGVRLGTEDYSYKVKDDFGNYTFYEHAFAKTADFMVLVANADVDDVITALEENRAKPVVYIGTSDYQKTMLIGKYNSYDLTIDYETHSLLNISTEGLT